MPSKSFKYFVKEKTQESLLSSVYGYFDFNNSGDYSNINLLNNQNWLSNQNIKISLNNNDFWSNSGFLNFSGHNRAHLSNINYENLGFLIPYYISGDNKDNIIISSKTSSGLGYASGYAFGINKFNYPYVDFFDYKNGPTTYSLHKNVNKTGIMYFAVKSNSVELGYYNPINKKVEKYSFPKNKNAVFDSKSWFIGGDNENNFDRFFSGSLSQIAIFNPASINYNLYEKNIISGLIYDLDEYATTGYISGQTGILNGDVIIVTGCYYYYAISGQFYSGEYQTGISYYPSSEILNDCLGREYAKFTKNVLSGYFSGYRWVNYLTENCFTSTGYNSYQYNSGFVTNYVIKTIMPILKYQELDNIYANAIFLKEKTDNLDILSLYALKQISNSIDNQVTLYDIFNKTYYVDGEFNPNNFSGFYYNGQLQQISTGYSEIFQNGELLFLPEKDFFISGSKIYSNKYYDFGNINIDSWPTFDFVVTGSVQSGYQIPGAAFSNQMIFLNGQKLNSGTDYTGNNILFNIPSGHNLISITRNKLNFSEKNIYNSGGLIFDFGIFTKNTSSVWINGIRLKNEKDYEEISYSNFIGDIFIKKNGNLIYNSNGN